MVNRTQKKLCNQILNIENLPNKPKSADSYTDELIRSLSEKRENLRAKQTWEWEQVRRNSSFMRDVA